MTEQWRPVVGYEGLYEVSDRGNVRSVPREFTYRTGTQVIRPGRILKGRVMRAGHLRVALSDHDRTRRDWLVHRLVLFAFRGAPADGMQACHNNDVKYDNRLENLRWDTRSENTLDTYRNGIKSLTSECIWGHEMTNENTYRSGGRRQCRACRRNQDKKEAVA